jgi:hypothetical protein
VLLGADDTSGMARCEFIIKVIECKPGVYPPRQSFTHQRLGFFCLWDDQFTFVSVASKWQRQFRWGIPMPTGLEDPRTLHRIPYGEFARVTSERQGTKFGLHTRGGQSHYFGTEFLDHDFGFRRAAYEIAHALRLAGYRVTVTYDALTVLDDAAKVTYLRPARIEGAERERLARLDEQIWTDLQSGSRYADFLIRQDLVSADQVVDRGRTGTRWKGRRGRKGGHVPRHGGEAKDTDEARQEPPPG